MDSDSTPVFVKNVLNDMYPSIFFKKIFKGLAVVILLLLLVYYYLKFTWIVTENEESRISILLYMTYVTLNIILIIACFLNVFMGNDIYTCFIRNIAYVDSLSKNLEVSYKDSGNKSINYKQVTFIITTVISYTVFYHLALTENDFPSVDFTEIVCIPLVWLLIFQINVKLNQISRRFNYIKNILEAYMENTLDIYWIHWCTIGPKEITVLNRMHLFTYISFIDVCAYYNIQLLVLIPRVIFFNVLPVHYNIVTALVADERNLSHKWSQLFTISVIILTIWPVIHLVKCTSNTIEEVRYTVKKSTFIY